MTTEVETVGRAAPAEGHLGIDIGGSKAAARWQPAEGGGHREAVLRWTSGGVGEDVRVLRELVRLVLPARGRAVIRGAAVALPATVVHGQVTAWPSRPSWTGRNVPELFDAVLPGVAVAHEDDGNLAALAEARRAGCPDLAYLGVGTGLGGGVVSGGVLVRGPRGHAGEIGHLVIAAEPAARCVCGRVGCLQSAASGPALLGLAARLRGRPVHDAAELRSGLVERRDWAEQAVRRGAGALAIAAVGLSELTQCAQVRIGGGFAAALPELTEAVQAALPAFARPGWTAPLVLPAAYGADASLAGAVLLARIVSADSEDRDERCAHVQDDPRAELPARAHEPSPGLGDRVLGLAQRTGPDEHAHDLAAGLPLVHGDVLDAPPLRERVH